VWHLSCRYDAQGPGPLPPFTSPNRGSVKEGETARRRCLVVLIRQVDPADALGVLGATPPGDGVEKAIWDRWSRDGTLVAFVAEHGRPVGVAIAESLPNLVHVLAGEGNAAACGLLLDRLMRMAGERDVSVRCPDDHEDLRQILGGTGFARQHRDDSGRWPSDLYRLYQNEG
jgi:hypothetical protein